MREGSTWEKKYLPKGGKSIVIGKCPVKVIVYSFPVSCGVCPKLSHLF